MNYQIEKTDNSLNSIKQNFDIIVEQIKNTDDTDFINETIDKVKLAREWAKIQKKTEEMYSQLLRIEIECYIRIYNLDCLHILNHTQKKVAYFFSQMTEPEIKKLIKSNSGSSAFKIFRDYTYNQDKANFYNKGKDFANSNYDKDDFIIDLEKNKETYDYKNYAQNKNAAIAAILDDYSSKNESFTVEQFTDDLIIEMGIEDSKIYGHEGFKEGIREVCRSAIRSAKTIFFKDKKTPRFVTCLSPDIETGYIRIPFENATLEQFTEMIELRKEQLEQDRKALENLIEIYDTLSESYNDLIKNKKFKKNQKVLIRDIMGAI